MTSILGIDKLQNAIRMIRCNGGIMKSWSKLWRYDSLKEGKLVGWDTWGNRYYENNYYQFCRNRWVEYYDNCNWNYDASMVTAEWYGWLHYKTDKLPCQDEAKCELYCDRYVQKWLQPHEENYTGTCRAYYPYSTMPPRIQVWDGIAKRRRINSSYGISLATICSSIYAVNICLSLIDDCP